MAIRNIIFDLGGIFIDIHYHRTRDAFVAAGITDFDEYYHQSHSNPLFTELETGRIPPQDFYAGLREATGISFSDDAIRNAWNAMLGEFRPASLALLPGIREQYGSYLLSNTNQVHYDAFMHIYESTFGRQDFNALFHRAYYSHQIGHRKPGAASYQYILEENQLEAGETLFVDDTYKNIAGAEAVGLQTLWLQPGMLLEEALPALLAGNR